MVDRTWKYVATNVRKATSHRISLTVHFWTQWLRQNYVKKQHGKGRENFFSISNSRNGAFVFLCILHVLDNERRFHSIQQSNNFGGKNTNATRQTEEKFEQNSYKKAQSENCEKKWSLVTTWNSGINVEIEKEIKVKNHGGYFSF